MTLGLSCSDAPNLSAVTTRLVLVGGGRMGEALLGGLLAAGLGGAGRARRRRGGRRAARRAGGALPRRRRRSTLSAPADAAVVAVKPSDVPEACAALGGAGGGTRACRSPPASPIADARGGAAATGSRWCVRCRTRRRSSAPAPPRSPAGSAASSADLDWAESILVGGRCRRSGGGVAARRGHRGVRLGPAYVFLVRRGADRGGRARGPAPRHQRSPRRADPASARPACSPRARTRRPTCAPRSPRPGGTTAAALRVLESAGLDAPSSSKRSRRPPSGRVSSGPADRHAGS